MREIIYATLFVQGSRLTSDDHVPTRKRAGVSTILEVGTGFVLRSAPPITVMGLPRQQSSPSVLGCFSVLQ